MPDEKPLLISPKNLKRLKYAVDFAERQPRSVDGQNFGDGIGGRFRILLGENAAVSGNANQWQYAWQEARRTTAGAWETLPGGRSGTTTTDYALNECEKINTNAPGLMGNGDDTSSSGNVIQPIPEGTPAWLEIEYDSDSVIWYSFSIANFSACGS